MAYKSLWECLCTGELREYAPRQESLVSMTEELAMLDSDAVGLKCSLGSEPVQGGGNKQQDNAINNLAKRFELREKIEITKKRLALVDRALDRLQPEDRKIIDRLFINGRRGSISDLCAELNVEIASVYRMRDRALHNYVLLRYGGE